MTDQAHLAAPSGNAPAAGSKTITAPRFTPGPWRALVIAPNNMDFGTAMVATTHTKGMAIDCLNSGPTFKQSAANAVLCAAAPDLYSALKAICDQSDMYRNNCGVPRAAKPQSLYEKARAALAKARGE